MRKGLFPVLAVVTLGGLVGCDRAATGPLVDEPLVPEAEVEELISVLAVYDSLLASEAMEGLREMGPALAESFSGSTVRAAHAAANEVFAPLARPFPLLPLDAAKLPSILPSRAGLTFVFSQSLGRYTEAPGRLGAPGNGVRITLYRPRGRRVTEIGWVDVIEAGSSLPNGYRVRVRGIEQGRLFADYTTSIEGPAGPGLLRPTAIGLNGRVIAGPELLDFDIESVNRTPLDPTLELRWLFTLLNRGFSIEASVSGVPASGQGVENLTFTLLYRGFRWRVRYNDRRGAINALIGVNGADLATVSGVISQPSIIGSSGRQLSPRTRFLIIRLLLVVAGVFEIHNDLFTPPASVILQGL